MRWAVCTLVLWACLASGTVSAQTPPAADGSAQNDEAARRNFKVGSAAFEAGQYEDALRYFERAYALSPRPELLYNIGQAADRLRQDERAIEALEGYLAALPNAPNYDEVENRVAALKRVRDQQQAAPTPLPAVTLEPESAAQPVSTPVDEAEAKPWFKKWWVWTTVGVIVAGGVTTAVLLTRGEPEDKKPTAGTTGVITYALERR
jgi:tetratricopeptide (TPR) repeat protein